MGLDEIAGKMRERLAGSDFKGSVKFDCGADGAVVVKGNTVLLSDESADCIITLTKEDLAAMISGDLDATSAFMQGKLKVDGNMSVALQLNQVL